MHRLKILETFPIFLCKIRGGADTIWEYYTKVWKVISWVLSTDLNVRTTLHVPKTADCGIVIISLVRQLYINSAQTKRHTSGENRAVLPKRGMVTQYRGLIARWWLLQNLREFQSPSEAKRSIRWKTVLKCPFFPPSLYLLFSFRVLLLTVSLRSYTLQVIESRCLLQQVHRLFRRFNLQKFYPKVNTQII